MKILFVASAYSIHSVKWVNYFLEKGHEIHLISLEKPQKDLDKRINIYLGNIFDIFRFSRLIKKINPDIVHAHYVGFNGLIAALSGVHPFILTAWGSDILIAGKGSIKKFFVKYILNKADLITCDAEHLKEAMLKMGVSYRDIKIIRFGVDTRKFYPGEENQELKRELDILDCPVVISLRNFEPVYDLETLLKSVPLVLKEFPLAKFIIMGRGSQKIRLEKLAQELNIRDNIRFPERVFNDDIPEYLKIADVYVSTSLSDAGIASSTAEAMACQLPIIVTDSGENRDWVQDNQNGFVIPIKSPEILAEKIIYLLNKPRIREKFGKINRETIQQRNNYYNEMSKMEKIYQALKENEDKRIY